MSKRRTKTSCLVIDASVAKAAGSVAAIDPRGISCRDALIAVRGICHRMGWNQAIAREWTDHQSLFAVNWLASMMDLKKLRPAGDQPSEELREAIKAHGNDPGVIAAMLKDAHLIEAALTTDFRIVSLDDNARGHFRRLATVYDALCSIVWVNPALRDEGVVEWLEKGARGDRKRRLKAN